MSSARLPGKVLRPIAGTPALQYLLERLARAHGPDSTIVATSQGPEDDPVAALCDRLGVPVHRGPLEDVAERFAEVVERFGLDAFVRVSGDSPLLDQRIVDRAVELFRSREPDLVTNVFPRSFPVGQSVEVVSAASFGALLPELEDSDAREHLTRMFYSRPERFSIENFSNDRDLSGVRLAIDEEPDALLVERVVSRMTRPHWDYSLDELVALADGPAPVG